MYYILEGSDGTGKSTFASKLIKQKVFPRLMYVYFEKENTYENTKLAWVELIKRLDYFNANIIIDRSVISTIAYHHEYRPDREYVKYIESELDTVLNLNPSRAVFIYFAKVFDATKLLEYVTRVESIRKNYQLLMNLLRKKGFKVIVYRGQKDFNIS